MVGISRHTFPPSLSFKPFGSPYRKTVGITLERMTRRRNDAPGELGFPRFGNGLERSSTYERGESSKGDDEEERLELGIGPPGKKARPTPVSNSRRDKSVVETIMFVPPGFISLGSPGVQQIQPPLPVSSSSGTPAGVSGTETAPSNGGAKQEIIPAPYRWAGNRRAHILSLDELCRMGVRSIPGNMRCKRCEADFNIEYELIPMFVEIRAFIMRRKDTMHDRAPEEWMNPSLPDCPTCHQPGYVRPTIAKKRQINWLFLLLGRMLGCCTLAHLKYFCKHTKCHRTGAKNRVLYNTYLGLCAQLDPNHGGLFDVISARQSGLPF